MLNLPIFKDARVVAGAGGLERVVRRVHIVSMPDGGEYDWTEGSELILSVGFGLRNDLQKQADLVPMLVENRISGFVLSVGHYFEQTPQIIIDAANAYDFPVIELPGDVLFVQVSEVVFTYLINEQYALQQQARTIHDTLMDMVLNDGTLQQLLEALAGFLYRSMTIENASFEVLADVQVGKVDSARQRSIEDGHTSEEVIRYLMEQGIYSTLLETRSPLYINPVSEIGLEMERIIAPIIVARQIIGYFWIIADDDRLTPFDEMVIGQAATIAALIMYKDRAVKDSQVKMRGDLFQAILQSDDLPDGLLESQAAALDFRLNWTYQVLMIAPGQSTNTDLNTLMVATEEHLHGVAKALVFVREQSIVVVLQSRQALNATQIAAGLLARLTDPDKHILIAVGSHAENLGAIATSYERAKETLLIHVATGETHGVVAFADLGVLYWLYKLPDEALAANMYYEAVCKLHGSDEKQSKKLLPTLEAYLETGGSIKEASEQLFVHRNTLIYRLERIEALTGISLKDTENSLNLSVALKTFRLRGRV
ncbi:MAG: PucR family transcriptional regulator ligand-binding domain-containing protein [Chloroflexota bacterium]